MQVAQSQFCEHNINSHIQHKHEDTQLTILPIQIRARTFATYPYTCTLTHIEPTSSTASWAYLFRLIELLSSSSSSGGGVVESIINKPLTPPPPAPPVMMQHLGVTLSQPSIRFVTCSPPAFPALLQSSATVIRLLDSLSRAP